MTDVKELTRNEAIALINGTDRERSKYFISHAPTPNRTHVAYFIEYIDPTTEDGIAVFCDTLTYQEINDAKNRAAVDRYALKITLRALVGVSNRAYLRPEDWRNPCSDLIDEAMNGRLEQIIDNLIADHCEYRLNGAGLKLYTSFDPDLPRGLHMVVGGDQAEYYPDAVKGMNAYLKAAQYQ